MGVCPFGKHAAKRRGGEKPIGRAEYRKVKWEDSEHLFERETVRSTARVAQRPVYRETQGTRRARPLGVLSFRTFSLDK